MIYPSTLDLTVLQDSTFQQEIVVAEASKAATFNDATNVVTALCHDFVAGDRVSFAVNGDGFLPCNVKAGQVYFVLASGLTTNSFKFSTTNGGSEVDFAIISPNATYVVGKVINLTGYTFDADVREDFGAAVVETLTCTVTDAVSGKLTLSLTAAETLALTQGEYVWDLKLKTGGSSYFYARGAFTVQATVSRD